MNKVTPINIYLYETNKEAMFITVTEVYDEDSRIPMKVNINHIRYFTRVADETGDSSHFGTFIYLEAEDYIHAEEEIQVIIKRINNAINKPLFNLN